MTEGIDKSKLGEGRVDKSTGKIFCLRQDILLS